MEKLELTIKFRCSLEIVKKLDLLLRAFPERFDSYSHIARAGIMALYRDLEKEIPQNAKKVSDL